MDFRFERRDIYAYMNVISFNPYNLETLHGRQQYWRNEFRTQLGRSIAEAHGLLYAYYEEKTGYAKPQTTGNTHMVSVPVPVVCSISSVCYHPDDRERKTPIHVPWPQDFLNCYLATQKWVRAGGQQPAIPEIGADPQKVEQHDRGTPEEVVNVVELEPDGPRQTPTPARRRAR